MMINIEQVRNDFPILTELMNDQPLVYLDSGATSLKPRQVMAAIAHYNSKKTANVHRGVYALGSEATGLYEGAREKVAAFINAKPEEVVFTKGATEALNFVAMAYGLANLKAGDEIITSELEHHSSFLPWQNVARITGAKLVTIPLDTDGRITVENFKAVLTDKTKVVAVNYVSNVMGYIAPVKELAALAHEKGAIISVDAAQAAPHIKIDVQDINADFLSITGHKMLAATGIGVLYGKYGLLKGLNPISFGGEMIDLVELEASTYKDPPYRFEAGTPPIAGAISMAAAIDYINAVGQEAIHAHELALAKYAIEGLSTIEGVNIYNKNPDVGIIPFNVADIHPHDMATIYDASGICLRAGHHCAQLLMRWLKQAATLRCSIYLYNNKADIDAMIAATAKGKEVFEHGFI